MVDKALTIREGQTKVFVNAKKRQKNEKLIFPAARVSQPESVDYYLGEY